MSVEEIAVIDIISVNREAGQAVLTISDHLDWSDTIAHQTLLQKKFNAYLAFVESDEILQQYPDAKNRSIVFKVVFRIPPDESGRAFLNRAAEVIELAGFSLATEEFTGTQ
jgi:hypothetical protein